MTKIYETVEEWKKEVEALTQGQKVTFKEGQILWDGHIYWSAINEAGLLIGEINNDNNPERKIKGGFQDDSKCSNCKLYRSDLRLGKKCQGQMDAYCLSLMEQQQFGF